MGWAARRNGGWRLRTIWRQIEHPHAGAFGLLGVGVAGVPDDATCEIDIAVGPAGSQQEAARLTVRGSGTAVFPEALNLRDGVPVWFRASLPDVVVSITTADIKAGPRHYRMQAEPAETRATPTPLGGKA